MGSEEEQREGQLPGEDPSDQEWRALAGIAFRVARQIVRDHDDALDVAQETLLQAAIRRATIQNRIAWVVAVARRLAWRALSRLRTERAVRLPDGFEVPSAQGGSDRTRLLVARVLEHLPDGQAQLLLLVAGGFTQREIAAAIGCKTHQVGPRLARARHHARRLRDEGRPKGAGPAEDSRP